MSIEYCLKKAGEITYEKGKERIYSCIVDKRGKIIAESANSYVQSHPTQAHYAKKVGRPNAIYLHSEMATLLKARGKGVKLYVARVNRRGDSLLAAPCEICNLALKQSKHIKEVCYSI